MVNFTNILVSFRIYICFKLIIIVLFELHISIEPKTENNLAYINNISTVDKFDDPKTF